MKKSKYLKYSIYIFIFIFIVVGIFIINNMNNKQKIKAESNWISILYDEWRINDSYRFYNKDASDDFFEFLVDSDEVNNENLNYYYSDEVIYIICKNDEKNYVLYSIDFSDNNKLQGECEFLGYNKNLNKLLKNFNLKDKSDGFYYEYNDFGKSLYNLYSLTFIDHFGNIIKHEYSEGYFVNSVEVLEGKIYSRDYNCYNYIINGTLAKAYEFIGWEYEGEILTEPFKVTSDMTLKAVVEEKEGVVTNGHKVFSSLDAAIENSKAGDTLVLMKSVTTDTLTIPEGVKLIIPADNKNVTLMIDGDSNSSTKYVTDMDYVTLTVDKLTVNGTLTISSVVAYPGSGGAYQGHTSGSYGQVIINKEMIVNGNVECAGYIKGNGKVYVHGSLFTLFVVKDFRGGTNTLGTYTVGGIAPFNVYEMPNVQADTTIYDDGIFGAYANLYAGGGYNKASSPVIGDGGVIILNENGFANLKYNNETGRTTLTLNGGGTDGNFSITVMGITATISNVFFPLPYCFDIVFENGTYDLNTSYKLLPGMKAVVKEDATVNLNNKVIVYSEFIDVKYAGSVYPILDKPILSVEGVLNINCGFGGLITLEEGGRVNVESNYLDKNNVQQDVVLELTSYEGYADGQDSENYHVTNEIKEKAHIIIGNDICYLEIGNSYSK